jgi:hypothetical protein
MAPELIFLDTEFTDFLPRDLGDIHLISLGLVTQRNDAERFYVEIDDTWTEKDCSAFVFEAVLPQLEGGAARKHQAAGAAALSQWITALGRDVEILATSQYDIDFFFDLLPRDGGMWPENLKSVRLFSLDSLPAPSRIKALRAQEEFYQDGGRRHHALDDALALRAGWRAGVGRMDRGRNIMRRLLMEKFRGRAVSAAMHRWWILYGWGGDSNSQDDSE